MPKLIHTRDGIVIEEYLLEEGSITIGRRPDCDIQIDDLSVSGKHATVSVKVNQYMDGLKDVFLEDAGSTNGTKINGRRIKKHLFKHGEVAQIGTHELTLVDEGTRAFETTQILLPEDEV
jgi:pSer/pThr/pTyr-binding forkhead associated (FHA) protein